MEENKMEIFKELVKQKPNVLTLPMEDLIPLSYVGTEAVNFAKRLNKKIDKIPWAVDQKERWLSDTQDMADIVIDIKVQIGRLLPSPEETSSRTGIIRDNSRIIGSDSPKTLPNGIDSIEAYKARQIAKNPIVVEEAKKEARENKEPVTTTQILNKIRYVDKLKEEGGGRKQTDFEISLEESIYKNQLQQAINSIPTKPPKNLTENGFEILKGLWKIILNRGREFYEQEDLLNKNV